MPIAEFEEKELEGPLNHQLCDGGGLHWPPGQVLERIVGFDAAIQVANVAFWASLGYGPPPPGLPLSLAWWGVYPGHPDHRQLPQFRSNLFLQYKRPEFLSRRGGERRYWRQSYYRFDLTPHQQLALEACARSLGNNGLVAYGSPVFYRLADLYQHIEQHTLIPNTHFVAVSQLANHSRYTYVAARTPGLVHSEPVSAEPLSLSGGPPLGPPSRPGGGGSGDGPTPDEVLFAARDAARAAVEAGPFIVRGNRTYKRAIARVQKGIIGRVELDRRGRAAVDAYVDAAVFAHMAGIGWMVRGGPR